MIWFFIFLIKIQFSISLGMQCNQQTVGNVNFFPFSPTLSTRICHYHQSYLKNVKCSSKKPKMSLRWKYFLSTYDYLGDMKYLMKIKSNSFALLSAPRDPYLPILICILCKKKGRL